MYYRRASESSSIQTDERPNDVADIYIYIYVYLYVCILCLACKFSSVSKENFPFSESVQQAHTASN